MRFKFERFGTTYKIFDTLQGQRHDKDRIASVHDPALAQRIVDDLNNNPKQYGVAG